MGLADQLYLLVLLFACKTILVPLQIPVSFVSDKVGCAADLVQDEKNGYIFRSNDITDIKEKINKLVNNKDSLAEMGQASADIISQWNFDAISLAIKNVLLQV